MWTGRLAAFCALAASRPRGRCAATFRPCYQRQRPSDVIGTDNARPCQGSGMRINSLRRGGVGITAPSLLVLSHGCLDVAWIGSFQDGNPTCRMRGCQAVMEVGLWRGQTWLAKMCTKCLRDSMFHVSFALAPLGANMREEDADQRAPGVLLCCRLSSLRAARS